jgi:hypothetical protein
MAAATSEELDRVAYVYAIYSYLGHCTLVGIVATESDVPPMMPSLHSWNSPTPGPVKCTTRAEEAKQLAEIQRWCLRSLVIPDPWKLSIMTEAQRNQLLTVPQPEPPTHTDEEKTADDGSIGSVAAACKVIAPPTQLPHSKSAE